MKFGRCVSLLAIALVAASAMAGEPAAVEAAPAVQPAAPLISQAALLARQQQHDPALFLLDVRKPEEFAAGHVPGAVNIPQDQVAARLAEVPKDKDVVVYCRTGRRAGLAADVLAAHGYTRVAHLEGDLTGWIASGHPVETEPSAAAPKP